MNATERTALIQSVQFYDELNAAIDERTLDPRGDDHELEVIGWATCWDEADDDAHRAVARFLISRGARHHIFSAIALNLGDEVRRIVSADAAVLRRQMSHNENHQLPLHFAVRMNRPEMVELLLELGADPTIRDSMHDSDALGWAEFFGRHEIVTMLKNQARS